jgi:hypothetical protein
VLAPDVGVADEIGLVDPLGLGVGEVGLDDGVLLGRGDAGELGEPVGDGLLLGRDLG